MQVWIWLTVLYLLSLLLQQVFFYVYEAFSKRIKIHRAFQVNRGDIGIQWAYQFLLIVM